jgi:hypothetical protein
MNLVLQEGIRLCGIETGLAKRDQVWPEEIRFQAKNRNYHK